MPPIKKKSNSYKVGFKEASKLIYRYAKERILEQIRAVAVMVVFLVFFQTVVLGIAIADASIIALGIALVIMGLTFFLEGLMLGIMPLGKIIGIRLPKKTGLFVILLIAFILGIGATFAEPAIGVLKLAGQSVLAWRAPLLFLLLNRFSNYLVYAIGIGVGVAVMFGTLRFLYGWSLKPFLYISVTVLVGISFYAYLNPNLNHILGLAWDSGGVTTGPVTVPLILALGIGISQVARKSGGGGGFGVVTMAALLPIIAVLVAGILIEPMVPKPMPVEEFVSQANREQAAFLFNDIDEFRGYVLKNADEKASASLFDNDFEQLRAYIGEINADESLLKKTFGSRAAFESWVISGKDASLKLEIFGSHQKLEEAVCSQVNVTKVHPVDKSFIKRNILSAIQSILPLSLFLLLVLVVVIRDRLSKVDELILGILFATIGLAIFYGGIELGLAKIGDQVGGNLPASFAQIDVPEEREVINNFDLDMLNNAILSGGETKEFFYYYKDTEYQSVDFKPENYLPESKQYIYTPTKGPLFGGREYSIAGLLVTLLFAFVVGYGATLAEPTLSAFGSTVEEVTVGTFQKSLLIQAVAVGVGGGLVAGMCKVIWNVPLFWMLIPVYSLLLIMTVISTEEYVDVGWDAGGVTTGPVTVPLVISMGLGVGNQVGIVEGFGVLSLAYACPILSVLVVGLVVNHRRNKALMSLSSDEENLLT